MDLSKDLALMGIVVVIDGSPIVVIVGSLIHRQCNKGGVDN